MDFAEPSYCQTFLRPIVDLGFEIKCTDAARSGSSEFSLQTATRRNEVSTGSDWVSTLDGHGIASKRPGRYRFRYRLHYNAN